MKEQPRLVPVGLEIGDKYKTPWSELKIEDIRGEYKDEDNREWYVRDIETGEELWVDWEFLIEISKGNLGKKHGSDWD